MATWLKDANGNRCSVEYFGSKEAAQKALDSLIDCTNCENCSACSACRDCSDCSSCRDCSSCSSCSSCSDCRDCSYCISCSSCSDCRSCISCSSCRDCIDCSSCRSCIEKKQIDGEQSDFVVPKIPIIENIDKAVLAACTSPDNRLEMSHWHQCDTTHCRGGWVVHLAGQAGYAAERFYGTALAAQLIYRESGSPINPCRFYDSNEEAMADMRKRAGVDV